MLFWMMFFINNEYAYGIHIGDKRNDAHTKVSLRRIKFVFKIDLPVVEADGISERFGILKRSLSMFNNRDCFVF